MSIVTEVLLDLHALFQRRSTAWYVFGAQAAIIYGRPRMTADIDVTVDCSMEAVDGLVKRLKHAGFAARVDEMEAFVEQTRVVPVVHETTEVPVDIVLAGPGLEQEFLERVTLVEIDGVDVPYIAAEDLVISKVLAGRPKDLDDVRGVLAQQGADLDRSRVRNVLDQLERALGRSDLIRTFENL